MRVQFGIQRDEKELSCRRSWLGVCATRYKLQRIIFSVISFDAISVKLLSI